MHQSSDTFAPTIPTLVLGQLSNFHTHVTRTCLASICAQLAVIQNAHESPDESQQQFEMLPTLLSERFDPNFYHSDGLFLRATGEPYAAGLSRLLFDQLRADKNFAVHTLRTVKRELLRMTGRYPTLERTVNALQEHAADESEFIQEYARNVLTVQRLRKHDATLRRSQSAARIAGGGSLVVQPPLFDQVHMWNALRLRFTQNWEKARQAQQQQACRSIELGYRAQLAQSQQRIDYEIRCKVEVDMFMGNTIEIMNQDCVKWMEKFDIDYETAEVEIQVTIDQLDELRKKRDEHELESERRQNVMDEFYRKRQEREEFERCLIKYTKNGLIIQIWWRAFMVRYGLGPYKLKKPKKQPKKK